MKKILSYISISLLTLSMLAAPLLFVPANANAQLRGEGQGYVRGQQDHYFGWRNHRFRLHTHFYPRTIIVVNVEHPDQTIIIGNRYGMAGRNMATIIISNYDFIRLYNIVRINNNINVDIDTGHNSVSFNTGFGIIRTGNVSIDINQ